MMKITVIIPVYNAEDLLEKAILSSLQFSEVKEILVVDDGSTDKSFSISKNLEKEYPVIRTLQHPDKKNHGDSASRNLALEQAKYEYIAFLDADDYFLPNRFDAEREIFKNENVDGIIGAVGTEFLSEKGREMYMEKFNNVELCTVKHAAEGREIFHKLIEEKNTFGASFSMIALTFKRTLLENKKLRLSENLKVGMDKEFDIKLAYYGNLKTGIIDEPVSIRTAHDNNTITKFRNHTIYFYQNEAKLYKSLYFWAENEKDFPSLEKSIFRCKYYSSEIAATTGFKKYFKFIQYSLKDTRLLKTRYRYYALKNHPNT